MTKKPLQKTIVKTKGKTLKTKGFMKNGQTKVSQSPMEGLKKLAKDEREYGIDDLVSDSIKEEEESEDVSETCE